MKYSMRLIFLLIGAMFFSLECIAADSSIKISTKNLRDGKVEVGGTFNIVIEAINCRGNLEMTEAPKGVRVVYQAHSAVNDNSGSRTTVAYTCKALEVGKYTFGPVTVNGKKSNTISYEIVKGAGSTNNPGNGGGGNTPKQPQVDPNTYDPNSGPIFIGKGNEEIFLRAYVNKNVAYEQEAIEYYIKVFTSYNELNFLGSASAPVFDGFVIEEDPSVNVNPQWKAEEYNGKYYKTAVVARYVIFPQKPGVLKIKGNTYTVSTNSWSYYYDPYPYYGNMVSKRPVQLNITPNEVQVNVKDLPSPVPGNFIGGVGRFSLSSTMPSSELSTNIPASMLFKIEGEGNINYIKLPDLAAYFPKSIEISTPTSSANTQVEMGTVKGSIEFDYSVVPHQPGHFTIAPLEFTYFDPQDGEYKKLTTSQYTFDVIQGQESAKSQQTKNFDPQLMTVGKLSLGPDEPYVFFWGYWLWYAIPVVIFIVTLIAYRKYIREHEDIASLRSKKANKIALKKLSKAYQCIQKHQDEQFYEEMLKALWGYLGDKLKMPTSELNRSNVGDAFKSHGVKESTFMPIINLIDECEYAKYTPVSRDANMRQLYADAVETISRIENEYGKDAGQNTPGEDSASEGVADRYVNSSVIFHNESSEQEDDENQDGGKGNE